MFIPQYSPGEYRILVAKNGGKLLMDNFLALYFYETFINYIIPEVVSECEIQY